MDETTNFPPVVFYC